MKSETKKLLQYTAVLFLMVLISKQLPHTSYSMIEYIIRPFKIGNGTMKLSGIVPLILFIFCVRGIFRLEKFKNSKVVTFLVIVIAILPIMNWTIDMTRTGYHFIRRDGLNGIDFEESKISLLGYEDTVTLNVNITIRDYSRGNDEFKIRVYLPKTMSESLDLEYYDLDNTYITHGGSYGLSVQEDIVLHNVDIKNKNNLFQSNWHQEKVIYELYNDDQTIRIVDYGN